MDKDRVRGFADKVYADAAGAMTVGMAYVGTKVGPVSRDGGQRPNAGGGGRRHRKTTSTLCRGMAERHDVGGLSSAISPRLRPFNCPRSMPIAGFEGSDQLMGGLALFTPSCSASRPRSLRPSRRRWGEPQRAWRRRGRGARLAQLWPIRNRFTSLWINALPDIVERLKLGGRVLDVGCGAGRVSAVIAKAFPQAEVIGLDPDENSVVRARATQPRRSYGPTFPSSCKQRATCQQWRLRSDPCVRLCARLCRPAGDAERDPRIAEAGRRPVCDGAESGRPP